MYDFSSGVLNYEKTKAQATGKYKTEESSESSIFRFKQQWKNMNSVVNSLDLRGSNTRGAYRKDRNVSTGRGYGRMSFLLWKWQ